MPKLSLAHADIYVPDGVDAETALARCTHLCCGAHQDDIELLAMHGIEACFQNPKAFFAGVVMADGRGSPRAGTYANVNDDDMQAIRKLEQKKAAMLGEYGILIELNYPSSEAKAFSKDLLADLKQIIQAMKPEHVYLHNPLDKHVTHLAVLNHCIQALQAHPTSVKKAYGVEVWRSLDWIDPPFRINLPIKNPNMANALMSLYDSQISGGKRYDLAVEGRRRANATFGESHSVDEVDAVTVACDLLPLIQDKEANLPVYCTELLRGFANAVLGSYEHVEGL
jgi:LmbE family N-acetylglucosaminyl deacetylase